MGGVLGLLWLYARWATGGLRLLTGWAVLSVLLFSGCCLTSRRLHDLGLAGWWTGLLWGLFLAVWPLPPGLAHQVCGAVLAVCGAFLCAAPGQVGPNRFGRSLRIYRLLNRFDALPVFDDRSAEEIIGYDEDGLPS